MIKPTRTETAHETIRTLTPLVRELNFAPDILGSAYGADMCDRALKCWRAADALLSALQWDYPIPESQSFEMPTPHVRPGAGSARAALRVRAGEPPLDESALRNHRSGKKYPPLSPAEHVVFGGDLKRLNVALTHAKCAISISFGKNHKTPAKAALAIRALLQLRAYMDRLAAQDCPDGSNRSVSAMYFGASA